MQLVFAPNSDALATATQQLVQGALQQWLGDLIQVEAVDVQNVDAELRVTVSYVVRRTQQRQVRRNSQRRACDLLLLRGKTTKASCAATKRRKPPRASRPDINGIDYLEVVDHEAETEAERQRVLRVFFVKPPRCRCAPGSAPRAPRWHPDHRRRTHHRNRRRQSRIQNKRPSNRRPSRSSRQSAG